MDYEQFNSLSKKELLEGLQLCFKNWELHFAAAQILADKKIFNLANSHLILAWEEYIKAITIRIKRRNPPSDIFKNEKKMIQDLFKNHTTKHTIAITNDKFLRNIISIATKRAWRTLETDRKTIEENKKRLQDITMWTESRRKDANCKKNIGFYVDLKNKKWISPTDIITKEIFEKSNDVITQYRIIKLWIEAWWTCPKCHK